MARPWAVAATQCVLLLDSGRIMTGRGGHPPGCPQLAPGRRHCPTGGRLVLTRRGRCNLPARRLLAALCARKGCFDAGPTATGGALGVGGCCRGSHRLAHGRTGVLRCPLQQGALRPSVGRPRAVHMLRAVRAVLGSRRLRTVAGRAARPGAGRVATRPSALRGSECRQLCVHGACEAARLLGDFTHCCPLRLLGWDPPLC